jgi:NAD(P)-dependent dehydrogenase (short-subunit alcohol dehydrogenase family)
MNRLDGKNVFISGAARGIGAETARLMAVAGARVAIGDVLDERGRATARAIEAAGGQVLYVHLDVTRAEDWGAAIGAAMTHFGGLDILVNNAGIFLAKGIEESTVADWERLCAVNLTGVILGTQAALPALRQSGAGSPQGSASSICRRSLDWSVRRWRRSIRLPRAALRPSRSRWRLS